MRKRKAGLYPSAARPTLPVLPARLHVLVRLNCGAVPSPLPSSTGFKDQGFLC